jgi:hypothetical protein
MKKLEKLIMDSKHPRISVLRVKYPFFLIDRSGNLIFTDKQRLLMLFGRLRGKTPRGGLQRTFPSPEEVVKKQRKLRREAESKKAEES